MTPPGMIPSESSSPRNNTAGSYVVSPGYDTLGSQSRWGIIPGESCDQIFHKSPRVAYPGKSISPGSHTLESQSPWGIILRWVNLPWVCYPRESLMTPGSQLPFLKTFAQALKGTVSQKTNNKGLHFSFLLKMKFFGLPGISYPGK